MAAGAEVRGKKPGRRRRRKYESAGEPDVTHKLYCNKVLLSDHARGRLRIRAPGMKVKTAQNAIQRKIAAEQRKGVRTDWDGAVQVRFDSRLGLWAVCYALLEGGWGAATIFREGWEDDLEECIKYQATCDDQLICEMAIKRWGLEEQVIQALENLTGLQQALFKARRMQEITGQKSGVPEEIASVRIILKQLEIIYGCKEEAEQLYIDKIEKLRKKIVKEGAEAE